MAISFENVVMNIYEKNTIKKKPRQIKLIEDKISWFIK